MSMRRFNPDTGLRRAGKIASLTPLLLAGWVYFVAGSLSAFAQQPLIPILNTPSPAGSKHSKHKVPESPTVQPNTVIPVAPLGFASPAQWYLGQRVTQLSLSFLDEDKLLFTFRVPGLIQREKPKPGELSSDASDLMVVSSSQCDIRILHYQSQASSLSLIINQSGFTVRSSYKDDN